MKQHDFDDPMDSYYRCFVRIDGVLYCKDIIKRLSVKWNGADWEACTFEPFDKDESVPLDEVRAIASFPPWSVFDSIQRKAELEKEAEMNEMIAKTKRRVIGYANTDCGSDCFLPAQAGDLSYEEYAAIVKDYRLHDYFYSGEEYQDSFSACTPILDNYRYVVFSRRGFGAMIANVLGDFSPFGYCGYTESEFIDDSDRHYPEGGLYEDVPRANSAIQVDENTLSLLEEAKHHDSHFVAVLVPQEEKGYYWDQDEVVLTCGEQEVKAKVESVGYYMCEEEYAWQQEARSMVFSPWQQPYQGKLILLVHPC